MGFLRLIIVFGVGAFIGEIIRRKRNYPEKSYLNALLNILFGILRYFKVGPFKDEITLVQAMKSASKETGLTEFGDLTFMDATKELLDNDIQRSLTFTPLGYIIAQKELEQAMIRRLKLLAYLKETPEILKIPIKSPVFVISSPRTGTTFIHRLLSLDPQSRAPLLWELLAPTPAIAGLKVKDNEGEKLKAYFTDERQERAKFWRALIKQRKSMGDNALDHMHEIDADLPEECVVNMTEELPLQMSWFYTIFMNYELFTKIVSGDRAVNGYRYYKQFLQILSYQLGDLQSQRRWVVKCPLHLFYIQEIAKVFPDAKLIW